MLPQYHALGAVLAAGPLARWGWSRLAIAGFAGAAVFVDVDHYLAYVWQTGDLSLRRAYAYHRQRYRRPRRWRWRPRWPVLGFQQGRAFHALPVLLVLFLLARRWPVLAPAAWGILLHRLQDEAWGQFD